MLAPENPAAIAYIHQIPLCSASAVASSTRPRMSRPPVKTDATEASHRGEPG
jgi:hypothetical protein